MSVIFSNVFSLELSEKYIEIEDDAEFETRDLPDDIVPQHYELEVTPYFGSKNKSSNDSDSIFDGTVKMHFKTEKSNIQSIVLQKFDIRVNSMDLKRNDVDVKILNVTFNGNSHFWTLNLEQSLIENEIYLLSIDYEGKLRYLYGFYEDSYLENGEEKFIGITHMSRCARTVFPC